MANEQEIIARLAQCQSMDDVNTAFSGVDGVLLHDTLTKLYQEAHPEVMRFIGLVRAQGEKYNAACTKRVNAWLARTVRQ